MISINCALCGNDQDLEEIYPSTIDDDLVSSGHFSNRKFPDSMHYRTVRCRNCSMVFSNPIYSLEKIANWYKQSKYTYTSHIPYLTRTYLREWEKAGLGFSYQMRVLDVGCGTGHFLSTLQKKGIKEVFGVEPSRKEVEKADKSLRNRLKMDLFHKGLFPKEHFDVICCFQTLDHIVDLHEFIEGMYEMLKTGGKVFVSVHDVEGLSVKLMGDRSPIIDIQHIYLFNERTLRLLFEKHGFSHIDVNPLQNTYPLDFWWQMVPIPAGLKRIGTSVMRTSGLGKLAITLSAGNLMMVGVKALKH